jgi:hypothetical protein
MKTAAGILLIVVFGTLSAFGDVAPDPGFKRISLNLKLEKAEDFPDYRLFIKSGAQVQEVSINRGDVTVVSPLGGGAYYSTGKLLAVPVNELANFGDSQVMNGMTAMQKAVYDGRVPGTIELVDHMFSRTVNEAEAASFQDPLYRIERDPQAGLKAVHVSGGATTSTAERPVSSGRLFWQSAASAIVAGIFLLFGIATLGILYFRKKAKAI